LHPKNTLQWISLFRKIAKSSDWTNDASLEVFNLVVTEDILNMLTNYSTCDTKLDGLIKIIFPRDAFETYTTKLANQRWNPHTSIRDYASHINELVELANMCVPKSQRLLQREILNFFISGLPLYMKRHILLYNKEDLTFEEAINSIEKLIHFEFKSNNFNVKSSYTNGKPQLIKKAFNSQNNLYCTYHKSRGHNTEDCISKRNSERHFKNKREDSTSHIKILKEPINNITALELKGKIEETL
jgi:hypothetical protein